MANIGALIVTNTILGVPDSIFMKTSAQDKALNALLRTGEVPKGEVPGEG